MRQIKQALPGIVVLLLLAGAGMLFRERYHNQSLDAEADQEQSIAAPQRVEQEDDEQRIRLDHTTQKRGDIEIQTLPIAARNDTLRAYGTVLAIQNLADAYTAYQAATAQLARIEASIDASRKEYVRLEQLHRLDRNASAKALEEARAIMLGHQAEQRALQANQQGLIITTRQQWGTVIARWLSNPTNDFKHLLAQRTWLIQLTLPASPIVAAAPARLNVETSSGLAISAHLLSTAPHTEARLQGRSFFYLAAGENGQILPGMTVTTSFPLAQKAQAGWRIPAAAVVYWQGRRWLYQQVRAGTFRRIEITNAQPFAQGWWLPQAALTEQPVVTRGAQLLLSEELRAQIEVGDEGGE